jgi:2'-5' RNA ligase
MSPHRTSPTTEQPQAEPAGKPRLTDRIFFCVFPSTPARDAIASEADALRLENGLTGKPLKPAHLHMTLHHLGDHPELRQDVVDKALAAAGRVELAPFEVSLSSACSFSSRGTSHPCVLLCPDERPSVYRLWRELSNQLMGVGLGRYLQRDFTPHVTFLHDREVLAPESIAPIRWEVDGFSLIHSLLGRGEYRELGAWRLRAPRS